MCRSGCPTQDHDSWGECFRASGIEFGDPTQRKRSRAWDGELDRYRQARVVDGLSPKSTRTKDINEAYRMADKGVYRT